MKPFWVWLLTESEESDFARIPLARLWQAGGKAFRQAYRLKWRHLSRLLSAGLMSVRVLGPHLIPVPNGFEVERK